MENTNFKSAYSVKDRVKYLDSGKSLTKQSFKDECDINKILKKWERTGQLEHARLQTQKFIDCSAAVDYQTALNIVQEAQESFDSLPSSIRNRFNNDPAYFESFVSDRANDEELIALGLIEKPFLKANEASGIHSPVETENASIKAKSANLDG